MTEVKFSGKGFLRTVGKIYKRLKVGQLLSVTRQTHFDITSSDIGMTLTGMNIRGREVYIEPGSFNINWEFVNPNGRGISISISISISVSEQQEFFDRMIRHTLGE